MSVVTTRAAIKAKLESVPNIGMVHDRQRFSTRESEFKKLYFDETQKRICGWNFSRVRTLEYDDGLGQVRRSIEWKLYGFMSFDDKDASEIIFDDLVESIVQSFRADSTLGGTCLATKNLDLDEGPIGIQVDAITTVMFAGVLCHRAELSLLTETEEPV
jgi:hypothetical protein